MSEDPKISWSIRILIAIFFIFPAFIQIENGLFHRLASLIVSLAFIATQLEYKDPRYYKWIFGFVVFGFLLNPFVPFYNLPRSFWIATDLCFATLVMTAPTKNSGLFVPKSEYVTRKQTQPKKNHKNQPDNKIMTAAIATIAIVYLIWSYVS